MEPVRVMTWNSDWCPAPSWRSARGRAVDAWLGEPPRAQIAVLTESLPWLWQRWPQREPAELSIYPGTPSDGAKVAVASGFELKPVGLCRDDGADVSEVIRLNTVAVDVPELGLRVVGIVVRYRAKVEYLDELAPVLRALRRDRMIVAGDVNCLPDTRLWGHLAATLAEAGCTIRTAGPHDELADERPLIDHIAVSDFVNVADPVCWRRRQGGIELSDHAAAAVTVTRPR